MLRANGAARLRWVASERKSAYSGYAQKLKRERGVGTWRGMAKVADCCREDSARRRS
jgi:hypothetical protein